MLGATARVRTLLASAALAAVGCGSGPASELDGLEGLAFALCDLRTRCGCGLGSEGDCVELLTSDLTPPDGALDRLELTYDPECVDDLVLEVRSLTCDGMSPTGTSSACTPFYGRGRAGDSCDADGFVSTCHYGLRCSGGRCVEPNVFDGTTGVGTSCRFQRCPVGRGLYCDFAYTCQPLPTEGQFCIPPIGCTEGLACTDDFVCEPGRELGEGCTGHAQCNSGYCPRAACERRPGVGEPCGTQMICDRGLECDGEVCDRAGTAICEF